MSRRGEEGYVLAAALAALLPMSVVAAALVGASVNEARRVAAAERAAADEAALDAAIVLAAADLREEPRRRRLQFDEGREQVSIAERSIAVRVRWESDKLDVNGADLDAIDARLAAAGLDGADRQTVRRRLEARRASGEAVRLVDDVLAGVIKQECAQAALTVFGGRSDWTEAADGETIAIGRPAAGARVAVSATLADGASARGREAVLLFTGDPAEPVRVMDIRPTRGPSEEGCHGA